MMHHFNMVELLLVLISGLDAKDLPDQAIVPELIPMLIACLHHAHANALSNISKVLDLELMIFQ